MLHLYTASYLSASENVCVALPDYYTKSSCANVMNWFVLARLSLSFIQWQFQCRTWNLFYVCCAWWPAMTVTVKWPGFGSRGKHISLDVTFVLRVDSGGEGVRTLRFPPPCVCVCARVFAFAFYFPFQHKVFLLTLDLSILPILTTPFQFLKPKRQANTQRNKFCEFFGLHLSRK